MPITSVGRVKPQRREADSSDEALRSSCLCGLILEHQFFRHWQRFLTLLLPSFWFTFVATAAEQNPDAGLILSVKSATGGATDLSVAQGISLFVPAGRAASPFVSAGRFEATWEGAVSAELRSEFFFQAELNGQLKLQINGTTAYEASADGGVAPLSKPIQLNKGANALRAVFTSPAKGDAFIRLGWTEKGTNTSPIPLAVLTHSSSPPL